MDRDVTYVTGECVENISTSCEPLESFLKILWFFSTRDIFYSNPRPLIRFWVIIHPPWLFHPPPSIYIYIYTSIFIFHLFEGTQKYQTTIFRLASGPGQIFYISQTSYGNLRWVTRGSCCFFPRLLIQVEKKPSFWLFSVLAFVTCPKLIALKTLEIWKLRWQV